MLFANSKAPGATEAVSRIAEAAARPQQKLPPPHKCQKVNFERIPKKKH
jgi:hypothetical protein